MEWGSLNFGNPCVDRCAMREEHSDDAVVSDRPSFFGLGD